MPAIARKTSLLVCLLFLASVLRADTHQDIVDVFASMTAALSEDNADGFMKPFDRTMPGYADLKRQIAGLILDYTISSSIEPIGDEADGVKHSVDLDWYMELTSRVETGPTLRRRKVIHCELRMDGKHWRILSLKPLSFFSDKDE